MNKVLLERFISKYTLGDNVQSVVLKIKNNVLSTEFITPEKSLLGKLALNDFEFDDKSGLFCPHMMISPFVEILRAVFILQMIFFWFMIFSRK